MKSAGGGKRFTLRLGQGFRFKDGVVVVAKPDEQPDIVFKYLLPQAAGQALRYNEQSQQVEMGLGPALTSAVPVLLSTHISAFDTKPDVARITSGDIADYFNQAPVFMNTRYLLLMNQNGDQYLLTLDELQDAPGKFDDWRIGFSYEPVKLPIGLKGGKINKPLPGKIIYRDWYRTKMIMRVDLTSGTEEAIADGILPSTVGDRLLGYGDSTSAYIVRDASGKILHTIRFNEQFLGPLLSPDGTRLLGEGRIVFQEPDRHPTIEGPKFLKRDGWYYILAPAGGVATGWQTVLRSRNIFGPTKIASCCIKAARASTAHIKARSWTPQKASGGSCIFRTPEPMVGSCTCNLWNGATAGR